MRKSKVTKSRPYFFRYFLYQKPYEPKVSDFDDIDDWSLAWDYWFEVTQSKR